MHNFPSPQLNSVAASPENQQPNIGTLFPSGLMALKRSRFANWRPKNSNVPWNFKYWLMCPWCPLLTEQRVTNTVTFSAVRSVHSLTLPERNRCPTVSFGSFRRRRSFQLLLENCFSNSLQCIL